MSLDHHLIRRHFGDRRTAGDRLADKFVGVFGSWSYIIWQTIVITAWMAANAWFLRQWGHDIGLRKVPDPYPFILLNLGFSAQASYAAPLVLMAQNRAAARDKDFAAHQFQLVESVHATAGEVLEINQQILKINKSQSQILAELRALRADTEDMRDREGGGRDGVPPR